MEGRRGRGREREIKRDKVIIDSDMRLRTGEVGLIRFAASDKGLQRLRRLKCF